MTSQGMPNAMATRMTCRMYNVEYRPRGRSREKDRISKQRRRRIVRKRYRPRSPQQFGSARQQSRGAISKHKGHDGEMEVFHCPGWCQIDADGVHRCWGGCGSHGDVKAKPVFRGRGLGDQSEVQGKMEIVQDDLRCKNDADGIDIDGD